MRSVSSGQRLPVPEKRKRTRFAILKSALRTHQWLKNLLVFVPLVTAHRMFEVGRLFDASLAFATLSLLASGVYVVNDLLDLESDRQHPRKKHRPFAAGELSVRQGVFLAVGLVFAGVVLALMALRAGAVVAVVGYAVLAVIYAIWVKRTLVGDVITLASLYVLRIVVGALAVSVPLSHWLLGFSLFVFLSLALMKRHAELTLLLRSGRIDAAGRAYTIADRDWLGTMGTGSGYLSVLVLALYITGRDVEALYRHPTVLWPACVAMLFWITRMWARAYRGVIDDDPVLVTLSDPVTYVVGAVVAGLAVAAAVV